MGWSHHQKTVVVDDKIGFCGGIDLCYGRYEDGRYSLSDIYEDKNHPKHQFFPGRDYQNLCIKGEENGPTMDNILERYLLDLSYFNVLMNHLYIFIC